MFSILIAEDDAPLRKLIKKNLEARNFSVTDCANGAEAITALEKKKIDLVLTDTMMPVTDGNELARKVKEFDEDLPVVMLTALDALDDKRKSYRCGADDYITKPVDFDELELKLRALLRRYGKVSSNRLKIGDLTLDYAAKEVRLGETVIDTTKKEFLLLFALASSPGRIFSRTQLLDEVWGLDSESFERTVDVHVNKLREKLAASKVTIVSVRGLGYKVEKS